MASGTNYPASKDSWPNKSTGDQYTINEINQRASGIEILERAIDKVRKSANESVSNSTTLQDDDHITLPVIANQRYSFLLSFRYDGPTGNSIKVVMNAPAGTAGWWHVIVIRSGTQPAAAATGFTDSDVINLGVETGVKRSAIIAGEFATAGTAGDLKLRWAQLSSEASAITIYAGGFFVLHRIP